MLPKHRCPPTKVHGATTQEIAILTFASCLYCHFSLDAINCS
jgi:hypothetical protein